MNSNVCKHVCIFTHTITAACVCVCVRILSRSKPLLDHTLCALPNTRFFTREYPCTTHNTCMGKCCSATRTRRLTRIFATLVTSCCATVGCSVDVPRVRASLCLLGYTALGARVPQVKLQRMRGSLIGKCAQIGRASWNCSCSRTRHCACLRCGQAATCAAWSTKE